MATKQKKNNDNGQVESLDLETAQAVVKAANEARAREFLEKYKALCQEYKMQLAPNVQLAVQTTE